MLENHNIEQDNIEWSIFSHKNYQQDRQCVYKFNIEACLQNQCSWKNNNYQIF